MKGLQAFLGSVFAVLAVSPLAAQAPVLSSIQAPYANLQSQVKMAAATYGAGTVAYGPTGTPLILGGSNFGSPGTVLFIPYVNGSPGGPLQVTASAWTSTMINVTVPVGATSGLIKVLTASGNQSIGLPFIVTSEGYGASCPVVPSNNLLQIFTSGLADGAVGQAYSMSLEAGGGKPVYDWSIISGSLPTGLNLNSSTGVISGTPTQSVQALSLTVKVTDTSSPTQAASAVLPLTIEPSATPTVVYDYCIGTSNSSCASPGPGYDPVRNLLNYNDSVTGTWSMTDGDGDSGYDSLNRLIAASATSGPYAGLLAAWNYDNFGNRSFENFSGNLVSQSAPPIPASTWDQYNANNQVQSSSAGTPTYDASGNVTQDDQNAYLYDADGRICAVHDFLNGQMTEYLYDADGNRVAKGTITSFSCDTTQNGFIVTRSYILGPSGQQLTEMTWSGGVAQFAATNVSAAGQLIASYTPNASQVALNFQLRDWLGTLRAQTDYAGNVQEKCESLPYGNGETCVATAPYLFTGKERDAESGNDYFGARYYASSVGRFLSPDFDDLDDDDPEPVPYADLQNPQTLNLYSYGRSNPLGGIDVDGHDGPGLVGAIEAGFDQAEAFAQGVWAEGLASGWLPATGAGSVSLGAAATGGIGVIGGAMLFPKDLDPGELTPAQQAEYMKGDDDQEHTNEARPSTKGKHQKGRGRKKKDKGGEKGDKRRQANGMWGKFPPNGWKGSWPPKPGPGGGLPLIFLIPNNSQDNSSVTTTQGPAIATPCHDDTGEPCIK
jgi:RHS repeat-associated protein